MRRISVLITTVVLALSGLSLTAPGVSATSNWSSDSTPYLESQYMDTSDDGKYVLVSGWTRLHFSSDGGDHFSTASIVAQNGYWGSVAVSSSGAEMYAVNFGTQNAYKGLWKSTDHGTTWNRVDTSGIVPYNISISDNARTLFLTDNATGKLWSSLDSGSSWIVNGLSAGSVAARANPFVSPDGSTVVASVADELYISQNQGVTWTLIRAASANSHQISSVAVSNDGSTIAFTENGNIEESAMFVSTNYGGSWTPTTLPGSAYFNGSFLAMSGDGKKIVTYTVDNSYANAKFYRSIDTGNSWTSTLDLSPSTRDVQGIHSSPNGDTVKVYLQDTALYTGVFPVDQRASATIKPSISGKATATKAGSFKLLASKGQWTGYPNPAMSYQWYSCSAKVSSATTIIPRTCAKISSATKSTLALTKKFKGKYVAVAVTGKSTGTTATTWLSKSTAKVK